MYEPNQETKTKTEKAKDKQRWKGLYIQPRDVRLLRLLLEQKFLTLEQIHRSCYAGLSLQMPRMRLRKLKHFGLVKPQRVYTESRQVYLLDRAGYRHLESLGLGRGLGLLNRLDLRVYEHDKAVTDLRLALEMAGIDAWKSERKLRREWPGARVSDAVFRVNGRSVGLEFESADKGAERYRKVFLSHLERPVADHILYVVLTEEKRKTLLQILESLRNRRLGLDLSRLSFALNEEILARGKEAVAVNLKLGKIKLGGI